MSENNLQLKSLKPGEFYGKIPQKRIISSSILSEVVHKQEADIPEHAHELAFFTLILGGTYFEKFGSKIHLHQPMSILWHRAGISHKDRIGENGARFFTVEIQPQSLSYLRMIDKVPEDFFEQNSQLVWLASRLYHEFKNWQNCSDLIAEGITLEMFALSSRKEFSAEKQPPYWLLRIVQKLNEEFKEKFTTEQLAIEANVHPIYLASVFRRFYRQTLGEYVQNLRITYASKLLLDKEIPIVEIAYLAGFSDQSHFTRAFKRSVGITPGAFRNSLR